jgi:hypothetical protein
MFNINVKNRLTIIPLLLILVTTSLFVWHPSLAQSQVNTQTWTSPINLSHSGSTTDPSIVIDSNGIIHVVWVDTIAGEMYTSYDGTRWSTPVAVSLPFSAAPSTGGTQTLTITQLKLIADGKGYVHAFWVDQTNQLHYSRVQGDQFANGADWDSPQILASSALDYEVVLDNQDRLHLAYVRDLDASGFPAGIYYRRSAPDGASWGNPINLYQSQYFRSLTNQNANVSIATDRNGTGQDIYIAWDNRPRKQVYFSRSTDGGDNWSNPAEIDQPDANNGFATPHNIRVAANDRGTMMEWQVGDPAGSCTQTYQWSTDSGASWSGSQQMLGELGACPQVNQYFESSNGLILLATTIQTQIYFMAWNGREWSDPQLQSELSGFQDSETYDQVAFGCRKINFESNHDQVYVVGCDTGSGSDIWLTSRSISDVSNWFPTPSSWSKPVEIASGTQNYQTPIIIADSSGDMHAFWTQININSATSTQYAGLFSAKWDGQNWSNPIQVISSPDGDIVNPSIVIDPAGVLYATWTVQQTGIAYFSKVVASRANSPTEWVQPVPITPGNEIVASPKIIVDSTGLLTIVYAVPINENRGIYLIQSSDKGDTWLAPMQVFDAAKVAWEKVGMPQIIRSSDGQYNVIWSRMQLGDNNEAQNIYYSRSIDGGKSWSNPESVVEAPIDWSDIVDVGGSEIHRYWLENQEGQRFLWFESSMDNGVNWSRPAGVSYFGGTLSSVTLTHDPQLQPYIFQITQDTFGRISLNEWQWQSNNWTASDALALGNSENMFIENMSAVISPGGKLGVMYASSLSDIVTNSKQYSMNFIDRSVEISSTIPANIPILIKPTSVPDIATPTVEISSTQQSTPVPTLDISLNASAPESGSSSWFGLIVGSSLAGLMVLITLGYGLLKKK